MRQKLTIVLLLTFLLATLFTAHARAEGISIRLLNRADQETTAITDGDSVRLSIKLTQAASADATVSFLVEGLPQPVATCAIAAGQDSCLSDPIPTLGWYWGADATAHAQQTLSAQINGQAAEGSLQISIKPRPVVMLHGFISSWETWQSYLGDSGYLASLGLDGFAVGDGQVPGVMNTGKAADPRAHTNTIAQNAAILKEYIAAVQQKTGAEKVDLLVHSMGGMISRYYIDRVMTDDNVAQVIFLGTPMAGSACTIPLAALGFMFPASVEIQPSYMTNIFNRQITHRHGIPFHMVAGTLLTDPLTSPCADAPSDTVVGLDSATSIGLDDLVRRPIYHGDLTTDPDIFEQIVRKLLTAAPEAFRPRPDPAPPAASVPTAQFSRTYTGHLNPGQTADVTIQIDPNVSLANFSLYDSSRSLEIEVRGASGNVIQLDAQKNGTLQLDDPETMIYLGYGFADPKPGAWVVTLKTTAKTPPDGADYALNARYIGGASLDASTSQTILPLGQSLDIRASLQAGSTTANVTSAEAIIRKPDGTTETLTLSAQTSGDYSVSYTPAQNGLYSVELNVAGIGPNASILDRAASLSFETESAQQQAQKAEFSWWIILALAALCLIGLVTLVAIILIRRKFMSKT